MSEWTENQKKLIEELHCQERFRFDTDYSEVFNNFDDDDKKTILEAQ